MGQIRYTISVEIYRGTDCELHRVGETFRYPFDVGRVCPWLMDSLNTMIRVLQFGGELPWRYQGSEFEKEVDPDGVTTEFVRCPDPTGAGVVAKITRTALPHPREVGWA